MKKRLLSAVMLAAVFTVLFPSSVSAEPSEQLHNIYGDIDHDSIISSTDALQVLRYSVGTDEYDTVQQALSDIDDDGSITASDALDILRYSVGLSVETKVGRDVDGSQKTDQKKTLVAYFSRTGNTETVADYIIELTNADRFVIEAADPYSDADIEYNSDCRANREQNDKSVRPEIKGKIDDISQYDTIYLGYAIWWGQEPRIIDTFLESYDFSDITVIPFCTSASSGISASERNIRELGVEFGELKTGRRFAIGSTREQISEWVGEISPTRQSGVVYAHIGENTLPIKLEDNSSARAFEELLKNGDLTLKMDDYGNFEKVGELGFALERNDEDITTVPGDLILYQGDKITIYYDINSWSFTRLGHIQGKSQEELRSILGSGSVTVIFSLR